MGQLLNFTAMDAASVFSFGNSFVLTGWILLLFFPRWKFTFPVITNGVIIVLAILYTLLISMGIGNFNPDSFSTLQNVKVLFEDDMAVAAGWLHYLAFDLLAGVYIVKRSQKLGIKRWIYTLALPFTFMFGPFGFLIYFIIKTYKTKSFNDDGE